MKLAYEVEVAGSPFTAWTRLEVTRGGVNVTVTLLPQDPYWTVSLGSLLVVRLGRTVDGTDELVEVVSGRVVGKSRVQRWQGDALRILVDGSDTRLQLSPEEEIVLRHQTFEDILRRIYVGELGFSDLVTNLPPGTLEEATFPVTAALHASAQGLIGVLSPKSWRDPLSDAWVVMDTRRPLPANWPARALPLGAAVTVSDDLPPPTHINQVRITYAATSELGDETGQHPYVEVTRKVDDDKAPAGYPESKTLERVRQYYEDPSDPTRITRDPIVATITEDFDGAGALIMRTESTYQYLAGTWDGLLERVETDKWVRVTLPGGAAEIIRARYEDQRSLYRATGVDREHQQIARYGRISGEVLEPDMVPLDEGSRDGLTGEDARQTSRFQPIEHSHEAITETGGQTVTTRKVWRDIPPYGMRVQRSYESLGSSRSTPTQKTTTKLLLDDASIDDPAIGRRAEVGFDGTPYSLTLAEEIVRSHLFGGYARVQRTASVALRRQDPTWHEGIIVLLTDREGASSRWLVESVSDEIAPSERIATTRLSLVELREA